MTTTIQAHPGIDTIDPHALGPLDDQPTHRTGPVDLFPGEERFLSEKARRGKVALRERIAPHAGRVLEEGERVLYLAQGVQVPPFLHQAGLGALAYAFHQVALLVTDRRLVEVLLDTRGRAPGSRIRAFAWGDVKDLAMRRRSLVLATAEGRSRTHKWKITAGGDRKLLVRLVPRLRERLIGASTAPRQATPQPVPVWHCPSCGSALAPRAERCAACGTLFRSPRLAAWLAVAIPGGGLFYAGHPVLGALDALGELILYGALAVVLATTADAAGIAALLATGGAVKLLVATLLTKVESAHLAHMLAARTRPEAATGRRRWKQRAAVGAAISLAAVIGLPAAQGRLVNVVDRDLRLAGDGWAGSFDPSEWELFEADESTRSEWIHEDGSVLAVMAFPLGLTESFDDVRRGFEARFGGGEGRIEPFSIGRLEGIRLMVTGTTSDGEPFVGLRYVVYDQSGRDIHMVVWNVVPEEAVGADERLRSLLGLAEWVDAVSREAS